MKDETLLMDESSKSETLKSRTDCFGKILKTK